mmetsp:Transcript_31783/g.74528  ORF Transcript_31783/g.74528 Transcript_31783/m.74528 type:complete len:261 (+) Transcript_31783:430-1212(+)
MGRRLLSRRKDQSPCRQPRDASCVERGEDAEQDAVGGVCGEGDGNHHRPDHAVRRAGQAHPRVQATAPQHSRLHTSFPPSFGDGRRRASGVHSALCVYEWQGGARLLPGQAHHQAHTRGRTRHQQRPSHLQIPQGHLPAQLQRAVGGADHPRVGHLPAHLHRRHRGLRNKQHEVCDERGPDRRNPGWGQRGDRRGGRGGHDVHLRTQGRRGRRRTPRLLRPDPPTLGRLPLSIGSRFHRAGLFRSGTGVSGYPQLAQGPQ